MKPLTYAINYWPDVEAFIAEINHDDVQFCNVIIYAQV